MLSRKTFEDERELRFSRSAHVPEHNFYRRLKQHLNLEFLYEQTQPLYGRCGQHSIDPVVFFKVCLVARLENIASDQKLIKHCSLLLDLLYFLGYQLDEPLPWYSTVSRTRQLLPTALFEEVFMHVLSLCAEAGMVSGHTQVIDSALIKANASMGSLELKVPAEQLEVRLQQVRTFSSADSRARHNKAPLEQRTLTARQEELPGLQALHYKWRVEQNLRTGGSNKRAKYTSNKTHYSPVDPDACQDCRDCPLKASCCGKLPEKRIPITSYRDEYERTITRLHSRWGRRMKRLRQATVEPVLRTLLNHMGMRKINTRGLQLAHKGVLVAAAAYNLLKLLRFTPRRSQTAVMALPRPEQAVFFCFYFWPDQEVAVEKGTETRRYTRVVQQAHSINYNPSPIIGS